VILFCHELETHDEKGDFLIKIKKKDDAGSALCGTSFDVVGWDGYNRMAFIYS
jgi:homogentisate 1,2-dioxygenase